MATVNKQYLISDPMHHFPQKNTTCIAVTAVVALFALGAIVIGIIAIKASLFGGLAPMNEIGWQAGVALAAIGTIALLAAVIFNLIKYCGSIKNQNEIIDNQQADDEKSTSQLKINTETNQQIELDAEFEQLKAKQEAENQKAKEEAALQKAKLEAEATQFKAKQEAENQKAKEKARSLALPTALQPILAIEFDKSHVLQQPFSIKNFLKNPNESTTYEWRIDKGNMEAMEVLELYEHVFDVSLLNVPLIMWIKIKRNTKKTTIMGAKQYEAVIDQAPKERVDCIDERIRALDQAIQITSRLQVLASDPVVSKLTVKDALYAWSHPKSIQLRLLCLNDEEVCMLTSRCFECLGHDNVFFALYHRLTILGSKRNTPVFAKPFTPENLSNIPLVDFAMIPVKEIDPLLHHHIPPLALGLIPHTQLSELNTKALGDLHWKCISLLACKKPNGKSRPLVRYFKPEQIDACIQQINCPELYPQLSCKQVPHLKNMTGKIFNFIFPLSSAFSSSNVKTSKQLPKLSLDAIYYFQQFFSIEHWKRIGKNNILLFDFSKIDTAKRQEIFNIFFNTKSLNINDIGAHLLKEVSIDVIHNWFPLMNTIDQWIAIGDNNVLELNYKLFTDTNLSLIVNAFFNPQNYGKPGPYAHLINQLPQAQQQIIRPHLKKANPSIF